ncbi:MAG: methyltransferase domain-containing protein [Gammaproteobacteria bacterium]|nr:methyltransferase domain-containing protein [Gammaproteobacteria bacterium]
MTLFPHARVDEFTHLIDLAGIRAGDRIYDIPSGGGYLRNFIPGDTHLCGVETSAGFYALSEAQPPDEKVLCEDLGHIPLPSSSAHKVLSLAGLHHLEDKTPFYREAARLLAEGGALCVADVLEGSPPARFLNDFLDKHSSMGHRGLFITEGEIRQEIESAGFAVEYINPTSFVWKFPSLDGMVSFMRLLLGIDKADGATILKAIDDILGYEKVGDSYHMSWGLLYLRAVSAQRSQPAVLQNGADQ